MAKVELEQLLAKVDNFLSRVTCSEWWIIGGGKEAPRTEIHMRGGKQVGVRHPGGELSIGHSEDIVHTYNKQGELAERYRMGRPPKGHTLLPKQELQQTLEEERREKKLNINQP